MSTAPGINNSLKRNMLLTRNLKKIYTPWLFVLPGVFFTLALRYYPMLKAFYMSLFEFNAVTPPGEFLGFKNYINIFGQQFFWNAWTNTAWFMLFIILIGFIPPIVQALFLSEIIRGKKFFSTIYLIPALIPLSINVILWKWIWNPDYGLANGLLKLLNVTPQLWLFDPKLVKFCIIFPGIIGGGVGVLLYLAAIMGIPLELTESAKIDGCSAWKRIRYITMPNITFIISIQFIGTIIMALQMLDAPFQFTGGGPAGTSTSIGLYIYNTVQQELAYGRANAASVVLFTVIAIITILQIKLKKSDVQ